MMANGLGVMTINPLIFRTPKGDWAVIFLISYEHCRHLVPEVNSCLAENQKIVPIRHKAFISAEMLFASELGGSGGCLSMRPRID